MKRVYGYGVRKGGELVACFTDHGDAVECAAAILENWWGALAVEWYHADVPTHDLGGEG